MSEEEEVISKVDQDLAGASEDREEHVIAIWAAEQNVCDEVVIYLMD